MVVKNSILHLSNGKCNEHEIVLNNLEGFIFESANAKWFFFDSEETKNHNKNDFFFIIMFFP